MDAAMLAAVGSFVLLGSATQRITGMGFALVASPLLTLALGARVGVQLTQVLSLAASLLVLAQVWRSVEVTKALLLFVPALVGVVPGAFVSRTLPAPVLAVVVGALVVGALLAMACSTRARVFKGTAGLASAGFLSGFMNVTAGVGGPAVVLYALSAQWRHEAFVATVQLYFAALNVASLLAVGWPPLDGPTWAIALASLALGLVAGNALASRVPYEAARKLVFGVALTGSLATMVKGTLALI